LFTLLLLTSLAFGLVARTLNLDAKPYWLDESYTLLRSSGHTAAEARKELWQGQVIPVAALLRYQHPSPRDGGPAGTIAGLAREEPQLPPLYFLLARKWQQWFGASKPSVRSLSVIGSLLAFPSLYWLCRELFSSPAVAWMAMALVAVSPIHLRYAQESRPYSLWSALALLCCAALLHAMRKTTPSSWASYSLLTTLALTCHLFTVPMLLAHGLVVAAEERGRLTRRSLAFLLSLFVSLGAFLPWLRTVWQQRDVMRQTTEHASRSLPWGELLQFWTLALQRIFVAGPVASRFLLISIAVALACLCCYSILFLIRNAPRRSWLFLLILMGCMALPLLIADLTMGGRRSTNERYFLLLYLVLQIAVAFLLATRIESEQAQAQKGERAGSKFHFTPWKPLAASLLLAGALSCGLSVQAGTWWGWSSFDIEIARLINRHPHPLVITDGSFGAITPLAHELNPPTRLLLLSEAGTLRLPEGKATAFLYNPSASLLAKAKSLGWQPKSLYRFKDSLTHLEITLYQLSAPT
jgi:uncharacterized membrane protein